MKTSLLLQMLSNVCKETLLTIRHIPRQPKGTSIFTASSQGPRTTRHVISMRHVPYKARFLLPPSHSTPPEAASVSLSPDKPPT